MKYILIFIVFLMLTIYLIIERAVKVGVSILIFLWDFKIVKERYEFWKVIDVISSSRNGASEYKTLKEYYHCMDELLEL